MLNKKKKIKVSLFGFFKNMYAKSCPTAFPQSLELNLGLAEITHTEVLAGWKRTQKTPYFKGSTPALETNAVVPDIKLSYSSTNAVQSVLLIRNSY